MRDVKGKNVQGLIGLCLAPSHTLTSQDQEALARVLEKYHMKTQVLKDQRTLLIRGGDAFKGLTQNTQENDQILENGWQVLRETQEQYPLYVKALPDGRGVIFASHSGLLMKSGLVTPCLLPAARAAVLQQGVSPEGVSLFGFVRELLPGEIACLQDGEAVIKRMDEFKDPHKGSGNALPLRCGPLPRPHVPLGCYLDHRDVSQGLLEELKRTHQDVRGYRLFFPDLDKGSKINQQKPPISAVPPPYEMIPFTGKDFWRLMPEMAKACDELICDLSVLEAFKIGEAAAKDGRPLVMATSDSEEVHDYPAKGYVGRLERTTYHLDHDVSLASRSRLVSPRVEGVLKILLAQGVPLVSVMPFSAHRTKANPFEALLKLWIQEKNHRLASLMARQECILELMPREEIKDLFVQNDKKSLFVAWELIFYALWHQIYIQGRDPIPDTLAMLARA
ncbi:MAG: hypothetical protein H2057_00090 [Alphaproteobacteria bacterium]|nr:hypothetical protein [Alphaproteobacteria bacterium]